MKMADIKRNVKGNRMCTVCEDLTPAILEVNIKTGESSAYTLAVCKNHFDQFKKDLNEQ